MAILILAKLGVAPWRGGDHQLAIQIVESRWWGGIDPNVMARMTVMRITAPTALGARNRETSCRYPEGHNCVKVRSHTLLLLKDL